jgi:hypothetical protein
MRGGVRVVTSNLTPGTGGIAALSDADVRRAIRAGIAPDGSPLIVMPWREYAVMTDADLADVIAFLRSLPPVDNVVEPHAPVPATNAPAMSAAASSSPGAALAPSSSAADAPEASSAGAYIATIGGCRNCHGANLAGTRRPDGSLSVEIPGRHDRRRTPYALRLLRVPEDGGFERTTGAPTVKVAERASPVARIAFVTR